MYNILSYAMSHAFNYKTNKNIYNILTGKKSHQTFFDASSQQLLSLYHSLPNLKYSTFEQFILQKDDFKKSIQVKIHPQYTYDSLTQTFSCIQLLIQTLSHTRKESNTFIPIVQNTYIQQRVKQLYHQVIESNQVSNTIDEIYLLFENLNNKYNHTFLHYYLQGYEESMYTRQQISLIEGIPQSELFEREMNELIDILNQLKDSTKYPILSQAIILSPLLTNTYLSYQKLKSGLNLKEIAQLQNVKLNTIEDHILEMYIKGYLIDYTLFINKKDILEFINYYQKHRGERLKFYKEHFPDWTYFQIKLVIVGIERGDLIAER
ncbi:helix-turn-helix domain-containing protein [Staphylococcus epidermidis]|uniref:helix-turn-helix domain-containing protein n=1 Tax=Staphylococcus epidermidis TaxID=1282 RepID=UPI00066BF1A9|nr:helix-turn-helix domain-containing protein [Staphylococcus epidermidis]